MRSCLGISSAVRRNIFALVLSVFSLSGVFAEDAKVPEAPKEDAGAEKKKPASDKAEQKLFDRLTEREDETRVEDPFSVDLLGHKLTIQGQYEVVLDYVDNEALGEVPNHYPRLLLEQEIELELFFTTGREFSVFFQIKAVYEEDLRDSDRPDTVSDFYGQRGEMWIQSYPIRGLELGFEIGRLNFEDDRRWWWDEDLDAFRVELELEPVDFAVAVAREFGTDRTSHRWGEPEKEEIFRAIGEVSFDWLEEHSLQLFALFHDDHSRRSRPERVVLQDQEDESDAELYWLGLRATGAVELGKVGSILYWLDSGGVRGSERIHESTDISNEEAEIEEVFRRKVRGYAFDIGITYVLPFGLDPRITLGYARTSGDKRRTDRADRDYRQSGLHSNEPGFGGVQRFKGYGRILEPELSNLAIFTAGFGLDVTDHTSIDLVYHSYRLVERADFLRDSRLDIELDGAHKDLGRTLDLVIAIEEIDRIEFEAAASIFRADRAFGHDNNKWVFGGFVAVRIAF